MASSLRSMTLELSDAWQQWTAGAAELNVDKLRTAADVVGTNTDFMRSLFRKVVDNPVAQANNDTAIHYAARMGHLQCVQLLTNLSLNNCALANILGRTPIMVACEAGHLPVVQHLFQAFPSSVHGFTRDGTSCALLAAEGKHAHILQYLFREAHADLERPAMSGITPLMHAARVGDVSTIHFLLHEAKVNYAARDLTRSTALMYAASRGHTEAVRLLASEGFDMIDAVDEDSNSALALAAKHGHVDIVRFLVHEHAIVDNDEGGLSPVALAAGEGHLDIVQFLAEVGEADVHQVSQAGTALCVAALGGHTAVAEYLLTAHKVNVDAAAASGRRPLHEAVCNGHIATVELLVRFGANVDLATPAGITALHEAASTGQLQIVRLLVEAGHANINAKSSNRTTPVFHAVSAGHVSIVTYLAERGADLSATDLDGRNVLRLALASNHREVAMYLITVHDLTCATDSRTTELQAARILSSGAVLAKVAGLSVCHEDHYVVALQQCLKNGLIENAQALVHSMPQPVFSRPSKAAGGATPLMVACIHAPTPGIVAELFLKCPAAVHVRMQKYYSGSPGPAVTRVASAKCQPYICRLAGQLYASVGAAVGAHEP